MLFEIAETYYQQQKGVDRRSKKSRTVSPTAVRLSPQHTRENGSVFLSLSHTFQSIG